MYFSAARRWTLREKYFPRKVRNLLQICTSFGRTKQLILMPANSLRLSVVDAGHEKRLQDRVWTKELPAISASG